MITKNQRRRRRRKKVKNIRDNESNRGNKLTLKEAGQLYESRRPVNVTK